MEKDQWVDLDPDLITSEICMQCGMCCKTTWEQDRFRKSGTDRVPYLQAMFADRHKSEVSIRSRPSGEYAAVTNWCSHLEEGDNLHHVKCGVYKDRPQMCRDYNCFRAANGVKRLPEYYEMISKLIVDRQTELSDSPFSDEEE